MVTACDGVDRQRLGSHLGGEKCSCCSMVGNVRVMETRSLHAVRNRCRRIKTNSVFHFKPLKWPLACGPCARLLVTLMGPVVQSRRKT
jgi:hypothetical protein